MPYSENGTAIPRIAPNRRLIFRTVAAGVVGPPSKRAQLLLGDDARYRVLQQCVGRQVERTEHVDEVAGVDRGVGAAVVSLGMRKICARKALSWLSRHTLASRYPRSRRVSCSSVRDARVLVVVVSGVVSGQRPATIDEPSIICSCGQLAVAQRRQALGCRHSASPSLDKPSIAAQASGSPSFAASGSRCWQSSGCSPPVSRSLREDIVRRAFDAIRVCTTWSALARRRSVCGSRRNRCRK